MTFGKLRLRSILSNSTSDVSESPTPPQHTASASPVSAQPRTDPQPVPFTIYEALYGGYGLEQCVADIRYNWHPAIHSRLTRFLFLLQRPKQALHHLLELLCLFVSTIPVSFHPETIDSVVDDLSDAANTLVPPDVSPCTSVQWSAVVPASTSTTADSSQNAAVQHVPQTEEYFPTDAIIDAPNIINVICTTLSRIPNDPTFEDNPSYADITYEQLSTLPGLMDEPVRTVTLVYAWFLASEGIPNGWLRPFVFSRHIGRRERPPLIFPAAKKRPKTSERLKQKANVRAMIKRCRPSEGKSSDSNNDEMKGENFGNDKGAMPGDNSSGDNKVDVSTSTASSPVDNSSRFLRRDEELHTLYAPPFIDRLGHLAWYTVRSARPGEIIGRRATTYARANVVRIHSCKRLSRSVQIHRSHVCNGTAIDLRLWTSWTHGTRASGAFKSLSNPEAARHPAPRVAFDRPVSMEAALAVGFRIIDGKLVDPTGRIRVVAPHNETLFKVLPPNAREAEFTQPVRCRLGMNFA